METKVFASPYNSASPPSPGRPAAVISPSNNTWNDFGLRLLVILDVFNKDGQLLRLREEVKLYIEECSDSSKFLRGLNSIEAITDHRIAQSPFLLTLGSIENYQKFIDHVGIDATKDLLLSLRDAAALRYFDPKDSHFVALSNQNSFLESALRASGAYVSYIGFGKLYQEALTVRRKAPEAINFRETVSSEQGTLELSFLEDRFGKNNSHVFIGPNGSGKTRLLIDLAKHVLSTPNKNDKEDAITEQSPVLVLTHEPSRWVEVENLGASVQSLAIHGDSWINVTGDLYDIIRASQDKDDNFSWSAIVRIVRHDIPLARMQFPSTSGSPFIWQAAREGFTGGGSAAAQLIDRARPPIFLDEDGVQVELSSGQKAVLIFLVRLFSGLSRTGLVIVDEPETHLHPTYIGKLMAALGTSLQAKEAVAVIATHSPYVVRHVPRECVTVLRQNPTDNDSAAITEFVYPTFQTRGGDIERISEFVFEVDSMNSPLLREKITGFLSRNNEEKFSALVPIILEEFGTLGVRIAEAEKGE